MLDILKKAIDKINEEKYLFFIVIVIVLCFVLTSCVLRDSTINNTNDIKAKVIVKNKGDIDGSKTR